MNFDPFCVVYHEQNRSIPTVPKVDRGEEEVKNMAKDDGLEKRGKQNFLTVQTAVSIKRQLTRLGITLKDFSRTMGVSVTILNAILSRRFCHGGVPPSIQWQRRVVTWLRCVEDEEVSI